MEMKPIFLLHTTIYLLLHLIAYSNTYKLDEDREKILKILVEEDGDFQTYGAITADEYATIVSFGWTESKVKKFQDAYNNLRERIYNFRNVHKTVDEALTLIKKRLDRETTKSLPKKESMSKYMSQLHQITDSRRKIKDTRLLSSIRKGIRLRSQKAEFKNESANRDQTLANFFAVELPQFKPMHHLVLNCKEFVRHLMSEEGESGWLDLHSFMVSPDDANQHFRQLKKIFSISNLQSAALDWLITARIYSDHLEVTKMAAKSKQKKAFTRALIEGAGPIGMYTAVQLFRAGLHVVLVNDRPEHYFRKQMAFLDPKWMDQLRFYLGTGFNEIFTKPTAPGKLVRVHGRLNLNYLESALKERLACLSSFVYEEEGGRPGVEEHLSLRLLYEAALQRVEAPTSEVESFYAILAIPEAKNNPEQAMFSANLLEIRQKKLMMDEGMAEAEAKKEALHRLVEERAAAIHQAMKCREEEDKKKQNSLSKMRSFPRLVSFQRARNTKRVKVSLRERAELQLNGEALEMRKLPTIPLDILVCAGGANDRIRDEYIGKARLLLVPKNHAVAVLDKSSRKEKHFVFPNDFDGFDVKIPAMESFILEQNFEELIKQSFDLLGEHIRKKYSNFHELMVNGLVEDGPWTPQWGQKYQMNEGGGFELGDGSHKHIILIRETRPTLYVANETPPALVEFLSDLEREKKAALDRLEAAFEQHSKKVEAAQIRAADADGALKKLNEQIVATTTAYRELRQQVERKWFMAIVNFAFSFDAQKSGQKSIIRSYTFNANSEGILVPHTGEAGSRTDGGVQKLSFDPANTNTFPLKIQAPEQGVKPLEGDSIENGTFGLAIAVGDALASPDFFTGSGLSSGRLAAERAAYILRNYHLSDAGDEGVTEVQAGLSAKLNGIQLIMRRKALKFLESLPGTAGDGSAVAAV